MVASTTVNGVRAAGAGARLVCADMVSALAARAAAIDINERVMRQIIVEDLATPISDHTTYQFGFKTVGRSFQGRLTRA
jgi:hypothetical protein